MRYVGYCLAILVVLGQPVRAQDNAQPEDYQKLYNQTLAQLKDAQNRKSELATANAALTVQVADLQKQQQAAASQMAELKIQIAGYAERTFFLRNHYNAWTQFIAANPLVQMQWDLFLARQSPIGPNVQLPMLDPDWPLVGK
jgi:hypothetical protein